MYPRFRLLNIGHELVFIFLLLRSKCCGWTGNKRLQRWNQRPRIKSPRLSAEIPLHQATMSMLEQELSEQTSSRSLIIFQSFQRVLSWVFDELLTVFTFWNSRGKFLKTSIIITGWLTLPDTIATYFEIKRYSSRFDTANRTQKLGKLIIELQVPLFTPVQQHVEYHHLSAVAVSAYAQMLIENVSKVGQSRANIVVESLWNFVMINREGVVWKFVGNSIEISVTGVKVSV